jgi:hypothetical protein
VIAGCRGWTSLIRAGGGFELNPGNDGLLQVTHQASALESKPQIGGRFRAADICYLIIKYINYAIY